MWTSKPGEDPRQGRVTVIGVGNPLMTDDGFGLEVLEALRGRPELGANVELVDGGTWGMNLLPTLEDADAVIFVDAINMGFPPGTPVVLEREALPRFLATKLSPHEIALRDVITLADLRGNLPRRTVAIGVQPETIALGRVLTPRVAAQVPLIVGVVMARLWRWGLASPVGAPACTS